MVYVQYLVGLVAQKHEIERVHAMYTQRNLRPREECFSRFCSRAKNDETFMVLRNVLLSAALLAFAASCLGFYF